MRAKAKQGRGGPRSGSATVFVAVTVVGLGAMSLGILAMNLAVEREQRAGQRSLSSFYAAEAGLSAAYQNLLNGGDGAVASKDTPEAFGSSSFYVTTEDLGGFQTSLVAVGVSDRCVSRTELIVRRVPSGDFVHAAFGDEGVLLGADSFVDSYDSAAGAYAMQVGAGGFALEGGDLGSNLDVTLEAGTVPSGTVVHGDVSPGVTGMVYEEPNTEITGSTNPLSAAHALPGVTVPSLPAAMSLVTSADAAVFPGEYHFPSISINGGHSLVITGPATIVVDDLDLSASASLVLDATNGPIAIYATGDFELQGGSTVTTYAGGALEVSLVLTADNYGVDADGSTLSLDASASFTGTLLAPNAKLLVPSAFEVFGAVSAAYVELASDGAIHYDEALIFGGPEAEPVFETLLWRPVGKK
jgi:hypothetical protein